MQLQGGSAGKDSSSAPAFRMWPGRKLPGPFLKGAQLLMSEMVLYTYAVSQSSEKIRWALDFAGLPYREVRLAPFVHRPLNASLTGGLLSPMPVLEAAGETLIDSTRMLEWLEARRAPFGLIPRDPAARAAVMSAESRFDHAGVHLLRWTYAALLSERDVALRLWSLDANPLQALALRLGFPLIKRIT